MLVMPFLGRSDGGMKSASGDSQPSLAHVSRIATVVSSAKLSGIVEATPTNASQRRKPVANHALLWK